MTIRREATKHKLKQVTPDELSLAEYDASRQVEAGRLIDLPIFEGADLLWTPSGGDGSAASVEVRKEVDNMPAGWTPPQLMLLILPMGTHWLFFAGNRRAAGILVKGATVRCVCRGVVPLVPAGAGEMRPDQLSLTARGFYMSMPVFSPLGTGMTPSAAHGPGQLGGRFLASLLS